MLSVECRFRSVVDQETGDRDFPVACCSIKWSFLLVVNMSTLAPRWTSNSATFMWPFVDARCKGLQRSSSGRSHQRHGLATAVPCQDVRIVRRSVMEPSLVVRAFNVGPSLNEEAPDFHFPLFRRQGQRGLLSPVPNIDSNASVD
jgi:hypothetical protein